MEKKKDITRGQFFQCCATAACSLVPLTLLPPPARAEDGNPETDWYKSQLDQARVRFAEMLRVIDRTVDDSTRKKILENVGRECARQFSDATWKKYEGNIKDYLVVIQKPDGWVESAVYDEANGTLTITDKAHRCSCPLVKQGTTPASQCECTLGWQRETYSRILGKPVDAVLLKSVLRGDKRCVYQIRIL